MQLFFLYICIYIDSTWESKEIKSNTVIPAIGAAADFKYLIRVPKEEFEEEKTDENLISKDQKWTDKYQTEDDFDTSDGESDEEEEIIILRCQTSACQNGDKCIPIEFDFIVHVRFSDDELSPQAADTFFPYTLPYGNISIKQSLTTTIANSSMDLIHNTPANTSKNE